MGGILVQLKHVELLRLHANQSYITPTIYFPLYTSISCFPFLNMQLPKLLIFLVIFLPFTHASTGSSRIGHAQTYLHTITAFAEGVRNLPSQDEFMAELKQIMRTNIPESEVSAKPVDHFTHPLILTIIIFFIVSFFFSYYSRVVGLLGCDEGALSRKLLLFYNEEEV